MQKSLLVWIGISLFVLYCMTVCDTAAVNMNGIINVSSTEDPLEKAREIIMERGKRFLDKQPLSSDMMKFIDRAKRSKRRKRKRGNLRAKRSNHKLPDNIYVFQNGNLVPFKNIPKRQAGDDSVLQRYTVVPLVIPVSYALPPDFENVDNIEMDDFLVTPAPMEKMNVTIRRDLFTFGQDASLMKMVPGLPSYFPWEETSTSENLYTFQPIPFITELKVTPSETLYFPSFKFTTSMPKTSTIATSERNANTVTSRPKNGLKPLNLRLDTETADLNPAIVKQRSEFLKDKQQKDVLTRILSDVEVLLDEENCPGANEGTTCDIANSWLSEAAGMKFDIKRTDNSRSLILSISHQTPPKTNGFMCDLNWTLACEDPIEHSGMVLVHGFNTKDKEVLSFLGECRNCEGMEAITGSWTIRRHSRDCRDRNAAEKSISDIWRKDNLLALQKQHLAAMNNPNSTHKH